MGTMDDVVANVKTFADGAVKKAEEFAQVSKVKLSIGSKKSALNKEYQRLGTLTYDVSKTGNPMDEVIASCITDIDVLHGEIADLEKEVPNAKKTQSCESCGAHLDDGSNFCKKCGKEV